ncbi:hypothetical protein CGRA01v4_14690 [Colletotrichum graminicola]|nr:hypothetical protein CGRA01v4_14690 [Colletotrichum graminicola]
MNACCCPADPIHSFDSNCYKYLARNQFLLSKTPSPRSNRIRKKKGGYVPCSIPSFAFGNPDLPTPPCFAFISSTGICALATFEYN